MVSRSDRAGETEKADWNPIIFAVQVQWVRRWFCGQAAAVYSAALLLEWRQFICFLPDTNNETDDGSWRISKRHVAIQEWFRKFLK
jgi:hypothetical protein